LISTALVDIDEGDLDNAVDLYEQAQQVFVTLNSEVDVSWAFVVQSRIYAAMGAELDTATALTKARDLARGLGRDETFIEQLLTDTGAGCAIKVRGELHRLVAGADQHG
jgi:hypothetical protein